MFHQFNHVNATDFLNNGTSVIMKIKYTDSYMIYLKKKPKSNLEITGNTKDRATE